VVLPVFFLKGLKRNIKKAPFSTEGRQKAYAIDALQHVLAGIFNIVFFSVSVSTIC